MSKLVVSSYQGTADLGSSVHVQVADAATGDELLAQTNTGITQYVTGSGFYLYSGVLADADLYAVLWDEGTVGTGGGEVVAPVESIIPSLVTDQNADIAGKTFLIKRNDTLPYLRRQLVDSAGNPVAIDDADTVMFTMRAGNDTTMAGLPVTHAAAVIIDADNGIVEYRWVAADTAAATSGTGTSNIPNAAEFELTRLSDGKIETFPQADYIAVTIPRDLDPGQNP